MCAQVEARWETRTLVPHTKRKILLFVAIKRDIDLSAAVLGSIGD